MSASEIETWFRAAGLPSFSRNRSTRPARQVLRILVLIAVLESALVAPSRSWPWWIDALSVAAVVVAGVISFRALTGTTTRRSSRGTTRWIVDASFVALPTLVVYAADGTTSHIIATTLTNIAVLALLAADDRWQMSSLVTWGVRYATTEFASSVRSLARSVPLLVVVVLSLLFTNELWQVVAAVSAANLVAVVLLLAGSGVVFAVLQARDGIKEQADDRAFSELVSGTPAESYPAPTCRTDLSRTERANVSALLYLAQSSTVFIAAALFALVLVVFASVAVPQGALDIWLGRPAQELLNISIGVHILVTVEQIVMAALLAGFSSLVFAVSLASDAEFQGLMRTQVAHRLAVALAVRDVYLEQATS